MLKGVWRKSNLPTLLVEMSIGTATMEKSIKIPLKTKNKVITWSYNPYPGHLSGENYNLKIYTLLYVHSSTTCNSQDKETKMSINRWMDNEDVYIYNGILLSHQNKEIMPLAVTWMDLLVIILSQVIQEEKDK